MSYTERKKWMESIAAGKKVLCIVCGEPLIIVHAKSGDLAGVKCSHEHMSFPLVGYAEREKIIESIAAGKKVTCSVCGEPLIAVRAKNGDFVGAKCPHEHEIYPLMGYGREKIIESIAAGKKVPCLVCGEPLIAVRAGSGFLGGAKCPHNHESWPLVHGETFEWLDDPE